MVTWCEDPWLKQVRDWGYIPVLLPKTGLDTLRVLKIQDKELNDIGSVLDLFIAGDVPAPKPGPDDKSPNLRQVHSGKLKAGLGLHFLHGALELLGVSGAARTEYRGAKSLRFTVSDISISKVDLLALDRFLAAADLVADAPTAMRLLTAEEAFICTDVIKATEFTVEAEFSREGTAAVPPVPVHPGLSASGEVTVGSTDKAGKRYHGQRAVVFGLKAARIRFADGEYRCLTGAPDDLIVKGVTKPEADWLESDAPFVSVKSG
jgi:hypothetical protein